MSTAALPVAFSPPGHRVRPGTKPALLVAEFRGTGDIAILIPFLRAAVTRYEVTLLAVPNAGGLLQRFVPEVELIPCVAPWALFSGSANLPRWPWRTLWRILRELRSRRFAAAASIWPLASDHLFLRLARPGRLLGYGRPGAGWLLNDNLADGGHVHRPETWRRLAEKLHSPPSPRLPPACTHPFPPAASCCTPALPNPCGSGRSSVTPSCSAGCARRAGSPPCSVILTSGKLGARSANRWRWPPEAWTS